MKNLRVNLHFHGIFQLKKQTQTIVKFRIECLRVSLYALYFSLILANLLSVYEVAFIPDISQPHKQRVAHLLNSTCLRKRTEHAHCIHSTLFSYMAFLPSPSPPLLSSPLLSSLRLSSTLCSKRGSLSPLRGSILFETKEKK